MKIFNKKKESKFAFLENKGQVKAYLLKENTISTVDEFSRADISFALEKIKVKHPEITRSQNIWIVGSTRIENIEKTPLNKTEMLNYVHWKLHDMVDVPVTDVVYDVLTNNRQETSFFEKYSCVALLKKQERDDIVQSFKSCKIALDAIDTMPTALRDAFGAVSQSNQPIGYLSIDQGWITMSVYCEEGLISTRHIELPKLQVLYEQLEHSTSLNHDDETIQGIIERLVLELQRNLDFIDRQYAVSQFDSIVFCLPAGILSQHIESQVLEYFNIRKFDLSASLPFMHASDISLEARACFCRGSNTLEQINFIAPAEELISSIKDIRKALAYALGSALLAGILGQVYEWNTEKIVAKTSELKEKSTSLSLEIDKLKKKSTVVDVALQKQIEELMASKEQLLAMQNQQTPINNELYLGFMKDLSLATLNSGVYLNRINFTEKEIFLNGSCNDRKLIVSFLQQLQSSESLKGKSLNFLSISQNTTTQKIDFVISSQITQGSLHQGISSQ